MKSISNIKDMHNILFNEKNCIDYLFENNILYKKSTCNFCNSELYFNNRIYEQKIFICKNSECHKTFAIYKDTIFFNNKLNCTGTLLIAYLWICKVKYTQIELITGFSPNTIVKFVKIFRDLVINTLAEDDEIIGRNRIICEIDESLFNNFWIIGSIERTKEKKMFFEVVDNRNTDTIRKIIKKHIKPGSKIYSDSWKGYQKLEELGMKHIRINHSKRNIEYLKRKIHSNGIEG
jgi:hypothetical protein